MGTITEEFLSTKDAAKYAGVHINTIWKWIWAGDLKASRVGEHGNYRILPSDIDAAFASEPAKIST